NPAIRHRRVAPSSVRRGHVDRPYRAANDDPAVAPRAPVRPCNVSFGLRRPDPSGTKVKASIQISWTAFFMPKSHTVRQGECISSIALSYGMLPQSLWEAAENDGLREKRTHMNALAPGDVVTIPDPEEQIFDLDTGAVHKFLRKGIPEEFIIVFE